MKLTCVELDWSANPLRHVNRASWEGAVWDTIREIASPQFATGRAVLRGLQLSGKTVRIVPWREPVAMMRMQKETKDNPDGVCLTGLGLAQAGPESAAADVGARPKPGARKGDSFILFTPQDFRDPTQKADSTVLHEFFHSLRIALGLDRFVDLPPPTPVMGHWKKSAVGKALGADPETKYTQVYNQVEEFLAVLVQNIYDSERSRFLRRDHLPPVATVKGGKDPRDYCVSPDAELRWIALAPELADARNFLAIWRHQIEIMVRTMRAFSDQIAPVDARFNPIFELYAQRDWFLPGGRQVNLAHA